MVEGRELFELYEEYNNNEACNEMIDKEDEQQNKSMSKIQAKTALLELFKPWYIRELIDTNLTLSSKYDLWFTRVMAVYHQFQYMFLLVRVMSHYNDWNNASKPKNQKIKKSKKESETEPLT